MSETKRTNYLVTVSFVDNGGKEVIKPSRFMVYNALNSKHAVNSVFSPGAKHIPWNSNVRSIYVVQDDSTSRVVELL